MTLKNIRNTHTRSIMGERCEISLLVLAPVSLGEGVLGKNKESGGLEKARERERA